MKKSFKWAHEIITQLNAFITGVQTLQETSPDVIINCYTQCLLLVKKINQNIESDYHVYKCDNSLSKSDKLEEGLKLTECTSNIFLGIIDNIYHTEFNFITNYSKHTQKNQSPDMMNNFNKIHQSYINTIILDTRETVFNQLMKIRQYIERNVKSNDIFVGCV